MSFASYEYLPFLLLVLVGYQFTPARLRAFALLLASYAFYIWWEPWHGLLLLASTAVDYFVGLGLGRSGSRRGRKALLWTSIACNLAFLGTFKYSGFAAEILEDLGAGRLDWPAIVLPLGLSFYTFQSLSYTIDVYRRKIEPCTSPVAFGLYVSFFPQLIAGPIERADHLLPQLMNLKETRVSDLTEGGQLLLWGMLKKWVVADRLLALVWPRFSQPQDQDPLTLLVAAVGMNVVLYLDFSAYTDMARGSARFFGVRLVENFRRPFLATSLSQVASRWHMSLQRWIGDYLYSPLTKGGAGPARLWSTNLICMGIFGLWHGAGWTFILWGVLGGVVISCEHTAIYLRRKAGKRGRPGPPLPVAWLLTQFFWSLFIALFFCPDLEFAGRFFGGLLELRSPTADAFTSFISPIALFAVAGLGLQALGERGVLQGVWDRTGSWARLLLMAVGIWVLVRFKMPTPEPFIYFQF
jgi:D-alanyl-lipoteichoic acid acyltransferase DltB (MBOAT superfamily)